MNLNEIGARFAVSFVGYSDRELKNDKKFVRWMFRKYGAVNGVEYEEILDYHACTQKDYDEFYPIWS